MRIVGNFRSVAFAALAVMPIAVGVAHADVNYMYGDSGAPSEPRPAKATIPWLEAIKEKSGGDIQTQFFGGGAVVTAKNSLMAMRDGLIDGAFVSSIYFPAETPVMSLFVNLGSVLVDPVVSAAAITEMTVLDCADCKADLEKWNVFTFGAWVLPSYNLVCKKPLTTLDEMKGLRVRASGHTVTMANALGMVPVNVTYTEVYEALQRNQVDCTFGSSVWLESLSIGDVAKNVINVQAGGVPAPSTYNIRKDLWESLTPAQRQIFIDTAPQVIAAGAFSYLEEEARILNEPGKGYQFLEPDQAVRAAMKAQAEKDGLAAVEKAKKAGVANAQAIYEMLLEKYAKWAKIRESVSTPAELVPHLKREIFDHMAAK